MLLIATAAALKLFSSGVVLSRRFEHPYFA
jgi:hypothetical protein